MLSVAVVVGLLLGLVVAPVVGLTAIFLADVTRHFPAPLTLEPLPQRSEVLDRNGATVATFYKRNRVVVSLDEVDPLLVDAVLAIEDNRFFQHGAMDPQGTLRAFVTNLLRREQAQGGSSITQRLVKMTLVEQAGSRRERVEAIEPTYERKVVELRHAAWVELNRSKEWILERYLNVAYFGEGAYGVEVAAQHYFSRSAADLSLRQAALLAGLVSRPEGQDPVEQPGRAKDRRNVVLGRMAEVGVISDERADRTKDLDHPQPTGHRRRVRPRGVRQHPRRPDLGRCDEGGRAVAARHCVHAARPPVHAGRTATATLTRAPARGRARGSPSAREHGHALGVTGAVRSAPGS